jgi:hypothetical protein
LKEFIKDYPMARAFLFYGGTEKLRIDDIEVTPYGEGLQQLPKIMGIQAPFLN